MLCSLIDLTEFTIKKLSFSVREKAIISGIWYNRLRRRISTWVCKNNTRWDKIMIFFIEDNSGEVGSGVECRSWCDNYPKGVCFSAYPRNRKVTLLFQTEGLWGCLLGLNAKEITDSIYIPTLRQMIGVDNECYYSQHVVTFIHAWKVNTFKYIQLH